jgi:hypothetical protein
MKSSDMRALIAYRNEAKRKALAIKEFIVDMGPENLSEKFRERYK